MTAPRRAPAGTLASRSALSMAFNANGSVRRIDGAGVLVNLYPGSEVEGGPANLWLRLEPAAGDAPAQAVALLGPGSPARFDIGPGRFHAEGRWQGLHFSVDLALADDEPAWFWHVALRNDAARAQTVSLLHVQDLALAPFGAVRLNEHYVSHYVDHQPLRHPQRGHLVASRQNLAVDGRCPWAVAGSLREGIGFATDALQWLGLQARGDRAALPAGVRAGLGTQRLQHEHSLVALQDAPLTLAPGERAQAGFFVGLQADHPAASGAADLAFVDQLLSLTAALPPDAAATAAAAAAALLPAAAAPAPSLFTSAPTLRCQPLDDATLRATFGAEWRDVERASDGTLLSFFTAEGRHVVLPAKEARVLRPHGHLLYTGSAWVPDERALTSTCWMGGTFHSMVTQGHVGMNRLLTTTRGYLGQFESPGQRLFVELGGGWRLLGQPSAFEMAPAGCRWIYRHDDVTIEVRSDAVAAPHALGLSVRVVAGASLRWRVCHHLALCGEDDLDAPQASFDADAQGLRLAPAPGTELARRFPGGAFRIDPQPGTTFAAIGGDERLFADGATRGEPFACIDIGPCAAFGLWLRGALVGDDADAPPTRGAADAQVSAAAGLPVFAAADATGVAQLARILPWYAHDARIHYLAPRGLEQFSGGGWGTRDVCQGPVEMLLAMDRLPPLRDLLVRVLRNQNADGDWPQWFTFFERDRGVRAGDSHGDVVFWPLLALAQYLLASGDAGLLDEPLPFFDAEPAPVWNHVERALALVARRCIAGTQLAAYGHGDWNDALQPADPALREHLCSAWTVTLHLQVLVALADALQRCGQPDRAAPLAAQAAQVRADFQRLLVSDGVIAGYALFDGAGPPALWLHPADRFTGIRYSALPMIHAVINDLLDPAQAAAHLALLATTLSGPDGVRLFDRPMAYQGGPMTRFQRAESSAYFGREIGLMYTHAHLRYAEALAHVGDATRLFAALEQAHPIALRERVPSAALRQANCYYSSSDAAFADRVEAAAEYDRVARGEVALEGGWRVYSSGPGIAIGLVVRCLLGLRREAARIVLDPVLPPQLDGLRVTLPLDGQPLTLHYRVGPAGCGVRALRLNGTPLPAEAVANAYRRGGLAVERELLRARLHGEGDVLEVETD